MVSAQNVIAGNVRRLRERIAAAAQRAGKSPDEIRLVAVSKGVDIERIAAAADAGVEEIGENYIQEAAPKVEALGRKATWHLVGHLQTNKAKAAVSLFDIIQTVDSAHLAQALSRRCQAAGKVMPVLVEVNTTAEPSKFGVEPQHLRQVLEQTAGLPGIRVQGLMTVGRLGASADEARKYFEALASLADQARTWGIEGVEMPWLSMGMSDDFEAAIEAGANIIRVGRAIFGPRDVPGLKQT